MLKTMRRILAPLKRFILKILSIIRSIKKLRKVLTAKAEESYFSKSDRKSTLLIYLENIRWIVSYNELNEAYFNYGFDERSVSWSQQKKYVDALSVNTLLKERNKLRHPFSHAPILNDKYLFTSFIEGLNQIFKRKIAIPKFVGFCNERGLLDCYQNVSKRWEDIQNLDVVCKEIGGYGAKQLFLIQISDGIVKVNDTVENIATLKERLKSNQKWLLQERIKQHDQLSQLYEKSVNTIRLVTYRDRNAFKPFMALLKIGTNGAVADNWNQGGMLVDVDINTGRLGKYGLMRSCRNMEKHPDTDEKFENIIIPNFLALKDQALFLHMNLWNLKTIGWDIAIGENGPIFVEGNTLWGIGLLQYLKGGLRNDIQCIFNE